MELRFELGEVVGFDISSKGFKSRFNYYTCQPQPCSWSSYMNEFSVEILIVIMYYTDDSKKTKHLLSLDGAKERLHLFKADLLEEGSFDSLVDGCEGVLHTASPVSLSPNDPQVTKYPSIFQHLHIRFVAIYPHIRFL